MTSLIVNPHPALCGRSTDGRQRRADLLAEINDGYVVTDDHLLTNVVDPDRVDVTLSPGATTQRVIRPRVVINHTRSCTTRIGSPHLYVLTSGMIEQYLPFIRRARGSFDADLWHHNGASFGAITHRRSWRAFDGPCRPSRRDAKCSSPPRRLVARRSTK